MTKVTIQKTKSGTYRGFKFIGHAEYASHGTDIVCASISVLVINTFNALEQFTDVGMVVEADEKKGLITCQFDGELDDKAEVLMDALVLGVEHISKEYGKRFCKLKFEEV